DADADVVVGKETRTGGATFGADAFRADLPRADLFADGVVTLMTIHRLFRLAFLQAAGVRFPEGPRRLEDHVFLAQVYTRTDRVAVLASYPCYHWIVPSDRSNSSATFGDPVVYF